MPYLFHRSLNLAFRQCKLHNIFIFGMAYKIQIQISNGFNHFLLGGKEKKCLSVLDVSFIGFQVKCCETSLVHCAKGSLGSWKASLQTLSESILYHEYLYGPLTVI